MIIRILILSACALRFACCMSIDPQSLDLGVIGVEKSFIASEVQVKTVPGNKFKTQSSCGCFDIKVMDQDPAGTHVVYVNTTIGITSGAFEKYITFTAYDAEGRSTEQTLPVTGIVDPVCEILPQKTISITANGKEQEVRLLINPLIKVKSVKVGNKTTWLNVDIGKKDKSGNSWTVSVRANANVKPNPFPYPLDLRVESSSPRLDKLRLFVVVEP